MATRSPITATRFSSNPNVYRPPPKEKTVSPKTMSPVRKQKLLEIQNRSTTGAKASPSASPAAGSPVQAPAPAPAAAKASPAAAPTSAGVPPITISSGPRGKQAPAATASARRASVGSPAMKTPARASSTAIAAGSPAVAAPASKPAAGAVSTPSRSSVLGVGSPAPASMSPMAGASPNRRNTVLGTSSRNPLSNPLAMLQTAPVDVPADYSPSKKKETFIHEAFSLGEAEADTGEDPAVVARRERDAAYREELRVQAEEKKKRDAEEKFARLTLNETEQQYVQRQEDEDDARKAKEAETHAKLKKSRETQLRETTRRREFESEMKKTFIPAEAAQELADIQAEEQAKRDKKRRTALDHQEFLQSQVNRREAAKEKERQQDAVFAVQVQNGIDAERDRVEQERQDRYNAQAAYKSTLKMQMNRDKGFRTS